ncbi:hypothetical protein X728_32460 [Mesorhizobium sp. L103C120A0]|nr:hypothetical protein X728_32460 [Mesorhizobium sp. L103C120A0]
MRLSRSNLPSPRAAFNNHIATNYAFRLAQEKAAGSLDD